MRINDIFPKDIQNKMESFQANEDFRQEQRIIKGKRYLFCYFVTLVDIANTNEAIHLFSEGEEDWKELLKGQLNLSIDLSVSDIVDAIVGGRIVCFMEDGSVAFDPVGQKISRTISTPQNENAIQSPTQGFIEDYQTNLGVLRFQMKSPDLIIKSYQLGLSSKKKIALCHIEGAIDEQLLSDIVDCLSSSQSKNANNIQQLLKILGQDKFSIVPTTITTELPSEAETHLNQGKAVLFLEGFPYAIVVPALVTDIWSIKADYNIPYVFMAFVRILRVFGLTIGVVSPGLYVAFVSVNPEVLRIQLALSIAASREGVPYPALLEVLFLLIILELIVEAIVRLPKSIGPTITMVGGVILGQAIVQAKLVSNMLTIVLAATTIANFSLNGIQNMTFIRISKYGILLLSAIFGFLGLVIGMVILCIYMARIEIFGIPYFNLHPKKGGS
ncbi:hypothetical protein FHS16_005977 [Paenibacillus endophyticus]|uniref:Uncharacterized protein n=1 Tax=Paenibacillus endophyticus TaxID=1294268 RepID=A0A7W5GDE5_9BACL|nr:spore germination protein [Paenibacillus endophyticus]MBB3155861.1 hypothetical protein [Paenibacillus endophyticus]